MKDRIIDVSRLAAEKLDFIETGLVKVKIEAVDQSIYTETVDIMAEELIIQENIEPEFNGISSSDPYYSFNVNKINPKGYGVQIGSYKEMVNLAKLSEQVRVKYSKDVIVQVKTIKGVKIYRIILGTFQSKTEANNFKTKLINNYPDCFIVVF